MAGRGTDGANEWRGHRIVTEDELIRAQHRLSDEPAYRRVRLRHGIILGLLAAILVGALLGAYLVKTGQWVLPDLAPKPAAVAPTAVPPCPVRKFDALEPRQVRVNVLNSAGTPGLAGATATLLKEREFRIGKTGNLTLDDPDVVAVILSGPEGYAQALSVQRQFKGAVFMPDPRNTGSTVDLVLGTRYKQMIDPAHVQAGPGRLSCQLPKGSATPKPSGTKAAPSGK
ncbi:LytR C-terminal domain-containing protein [Paeniglutamicibacter cryotolerans]|uniref:LytR/CpsA/Psr regulator C-terminal domain-containing protein n=1 Tax=Paeniglutamicibacter cryotolerans TaxID=670079 RepID=A0A839QMH8_9MICC|nr:LytR C-terminal domain-containing protein [Paeniglutamicibacter cryotolerans]MBB2995206.1 hypothetical protein [Paeniglutamicibacter cryotolerans]